MGSGLLTVRPQSPGCSSLDGDSSQPADCHTLVLSIPTSLGPVACQVAGIADRDGDRQVDVRAMVEQCSQAHPGCCVLLRGDIFEMLRTK